MLNRGRTLSNKKGQNKTGGGGSLPRFAQYCKPVHPIGVLLALAPEPVTFARITPV